jgi:hypothetical protein
MGKSKGPHTPSGKRRASQNAAKYWVTSRRILESEQEAAAYLHQGLVEDFKPEGLVENELVDDLVLNRLMRKRIDLAFTREYSKATTRTPLLCLEDKEATQIQFWLRAHPKKGPRPRRTRRSITPRVVHQGT